MGPAHGGVMLPGETVTVLSAGQRTDPYSGETVYDDWGNATSVDVDDVLVGSGGSSEPLIDARTPVDSDFDLFFQTLEPIPVTSANRIRVRGLDCDVAGRPFLWRMSGVGGWVLKVKIREG